MNALRTSRRAALLAAPAATLVAALAANGTARAQQITPAPAFNAEREGGGAALTRGLTREAALAVIAAGRNTIPAFRASYTDQELRDLAAFVAERLSADRAD